MYSFANTLIKGKTLESMCLDLKPTSVPTSYMMKGKLSNFYDSVSLSVKLD